MAHQPGWEPLYLGSATQAVAWARGWIEEEPREEDGWVEFTPEARDYWVGEVEAAIVALQRVRHVLLARDLRTCLGCGVSFVGGPRARYHSPACKQRAYRRRQRDG